MFFLGPESEQFCSVTGRSGMTFATWIVAVVCETWTDVVVRTGTDAEKVYWTLRQVGTLELLSD